MNLWTALMWFTSNVRKFTHSLTPQLPSAVYIQCDDLITSSESVFTAAKMDQSGWGEFHFRIELNCYCSSLLIPRLKLQFGFTPAVGSCRNERLRWPLPRTRLKSSENLMTSAPVRVLWDSTYIYYWAKAFPSWVITVENEGQIRLAWKLIILLDLGAGALTAFTVGRTVMEVSSISMPYILIW